MAVDTNITISLIIVFIMAIICAGYWGYQIAAEKKKNDQIKNVKYYLDHTIPNEWTAYKKGVNEGYEQGLRDGQEDPE